MRDKDNKDLQHWSEFKSKFAAIEFPEPSSAFRESVVQKIAERHDMRERFSGLFAWTKLASVPLAAIVAYLVVSPLFIGSSGSNTPEFSADASYDIAWLLDEDVDNNTDEPVEDLVDEIIYGGADSEAEEVDTYELL